jgi:hypothetical protein
MGAVTVVRAQDAIPDLKGTWSGKGKSIVFGNNPHHPGRQTVASPPRIRDFEFTFVVDGQEGGSPGGTPYLPPLAQTSPSPGPFLPTTN